MPVLGYIEANEDALLHLEERVGMAYAQSIGKPWPMPPDFVGAGKFPCGLSRRARYEDLTEQQKSRVPKQRCMKVAVRYKDVDNTDQRVGGVFVVDDNVDRLNVREVRSAMRQRAQLSADARGLLDRLPEVALDAARRVRQ